MGWLDQAKNEVGLSTDESVENRHERERAQSYQSNFDAELGDARVQHGGGTLEARRPTATRC